MVNLAIFASGEGTNAENLINYYTTKDIKTGNRISRGDINISFVLTNNPTAGVIERCKRLKQKYYISSLYREIDQLITEHNVHYIILAGFLIKIPPKFCKKYHERIINIHPSLLPKYGGKGMYGIHVHKAVIKNEEKESGLSIHLVNEEYDDGLILFQSKCKVYKDDTPESLQSRIQSLEHSIYPKVIENIIRTKFHLMFGENA